MHIAKKFKGSDRPALARIAAVAAATAAVVSLAGKAVAAEPTQKELIDQVNALQARIDQLEAKGEARQQQADSRQVDATVDAIKADAQRHSQLLDVEGFTAGYSDGKFILKSGDGSFLLHPWAQFQFRSTTTYREGVKQAGTADDLENGFEVRRLKLGFDGNLFGPELTYLFLWATDRKTGSLSLEQAWAKYHIGGTPFAVRAGQIKDPLDHEQVVSSKYFAAADRTLIDDVFAGGEGLTQGVTLIYDDGGALRAEGGFTDGLGAFNSNFQDYPTTQADWGAAGRVEYKLFGNWADYEKLSAAGAKEDLLVVGAGADYTEAGHTARFVHVLDAQYTGKNGLGAYAAYLGRYTKGNTIGTGSAAVTNDTYDATLRGQLSYAIDKHWEPFVQYEYIHFDSDGLAHGSETNVHVLRAGANYYLHGHAAKFTLDVSYLPNGSPVSDDATGVLIDNGHNELIVRGQLQLLL